MKTLKTNKKFYNKWLYKVSLIMKGVSVFRSYSISDIKEYYSQSDPDSRPYSLLARGWPHRLELVELADVLLTHDPKIWTKRIENTLIDFYTNDVAFYNDISDKFKDLISQRFEPDESCSDLLDAPQTIITAKLPHNKYRYRVYLKPHKLAGDRDSKQKYVDWLKGQHPRITCTPAVERWFIKTDWNWDRRYVLVEDDQTLLMLKLRNSEVAGRVYNYVIADK
jgi:hypothetical protein